MTHRDRKLLDLAHDAPCCLQIVAVGCGEFKSVPCHSDMLEHGRGVGHKSHDCLAVSGCPPCHAAFTRAKLGRDGYEAVWLRAFVNYQLYLWESGKVRVA